MPVPKEFCAHYCQPQICYAIIHIGRENSSFQNLTGTASSATIQDKITVLVTTLRIYPWNNEVEIKKSHEKLEDIRRSHEKLILKSQSLKQGSQNDVGTSPCNEITLNRVTNYNSF